MVVALAGLVDVDRGQRSRRHLGDADDESEGRAVGVIISSSLGSACSTF